MKVAPRRRLGTARWRGLGRRALISTVLRSPIAPLRLANGAGDTSSESLRLRGEAERVRRGSSNKRLAGGRGGAQTGELADIKNLAARTQRAHEKGIGGSFEEEVNLYL